MDKRTKGCLWIGLGAAIAGAMVLIAVIAGAGYWVYQTVAPSAQHVDPQAADKAFATILSEFKDPTPRLTSSADGNDAQVVLAERPPFTGQLQSLHVAAYDPQEKKMVRFSIPFWLIRMGSDGTISVGDGPLGGVRAVEKLTVKDLEALGPGLLIDERNADGHRALVWTE